MGAIKDFIVKKKLQGENSSIMDYVSDEDKSNLKMYCWDCKEYIPKKEYTHHKCGDKK